MTMAGSKTFQNREFRCPLRRMWSFEADRHLTTHLGPSRRRRGAQAPESCPSAFRRRSRRRLTPRLQTVHLVASVALMRRRLTKEECEIRRGRGTPFSRWWPLAVMLLAVGLISQDLSLFKRCLGNPIEVSGRGGAAVRMLAAVPCSAFLLRGSPWDLLLIAGLWLPLPFAVVNRRWQRRHKEYWDKVRFREAQRRSDTRSSRTRARDG